MHDLARDGLMPFAFRLQLTYAIPFDAFMRAFHAGWGTSGALKALDLDRTFVSAGSSAGQPGYATQSMITVNNALERLHKHERDLIGWLITTRERPNVTLATLGKEWCNISDRDSARGAATGLLHGLARAIAQHYSVKR